MSIVFTAFPIAVLSQYIFGTLLFLLSSFLILLILLQQGRGGGLTGALGGPGGQSAFGTKAGDIFTRITIVTATLWIFLAATCVYFYTEPPAGSALSNTTADLTPATTVGGSGDLPTLGNDSSFPASGLSLPNTPLPTAPAAGALDAGAVVPATEDAPAADSMGTETQAEVTEMEGAVDVPPTPSEDSAPATETPVAPASEPETTPNPAAE